jgi:GTP cyclohydrolase IA
MSTTTKTIASNVHTIIESLGENPAREGLINTPHRVAESLQALTKGYNEDLASLTDGALFDSDINEMVMVKDIDFYSLCEHHMLPFFGKCHVAYLPDGKVLGVSRIAQIVDMFAKRLQIQERLTQQIAESIFEVTGAKGVGVVIEAQHLCMMMRGVQKQNSSMTTSVMLGLLRDRDRTRSEFLTLIRT